MNTRIGLSIAALLAACAGAGLALAQSAPVTPSRPSAARVEIITTDDPGVTVHSDAAWTIASVQDGRSITLHGKGDTINAEVDGKAVPADRIERDGDVVRIKDESGQTIFEQMVMRPSLATIQSPNAALLQVRPFRARAFSSGAGGAAGGSNNAWGNIYAPRAGTLAIDPIDAPAPPKVMIGVQLIEPDGSLRGHLGLKEGETTLISAVYEGLPASAAGLEPYDIIVAIEGKTPADPTSVRAALRDKDAEQGVSFDVLHRGQKKTVTIKVEKYDADKMEKVKVNAIPMAAGNANDVFQALAVAPGAPVQAWTLNRSGPIVGGTTGPDGKPRSQIFWRAQGDAMNEEAAKRAEEIAQKMAAQADEMVRSLEKTGGTAEEINKRMEERMRKLEEMLRQMMEQQQRGVPVPSNPPAPGAPGTGSEKQSLRRIDARFTS